MIHYVLLGLTFVFDILPFLFVNDSLAYAAGPGVYVSLFVYCSKNVNLSIVHFLVLCYNVIFKFAAACKILMQRHLIYSALAIDLFI